MKKSVVLFFVIAFLSVSFTAPAVAALKKGIYRAVLKRDDGREIVFQLNVSTQQGRNIIEVVNAAERMKVTDISYAGDSVMFEMPFFDSGFRAKIEKNGDLSGIWIKRGAAADQVMPFAATYNQSQRFPVSRQPGANISGKWDVEFTSRSGTGEAAVGEFTQNGDRLTGTFLTPTGDYRFLEGVVSGDSLYLSGFDGSHAFLFTARLEDKQNITGGHFYSGKTSDQSWTARKDETAKLRDGYSDTKIKNGSAYLDFAFPDINGKKISIRDANYRGKVVVVQIMGSWCPNCMDETNFLSSYYNANKQRGFEVIALAYERYSDFAKASRLLQPFRQRFNVKYPMLVTGVTVTDSLRTEKTLPQLEKIVAFPTSIFVDKSGKVRKIYTGFSGPGTGQHYLEFKKEFEATIDELLAEKI